MNLKRVIIRTGRIMVVSGTVFLFTLIVLFGLAQTDLGKKGSVRIITAILSREGESCVEIEGLTGLIPIDFQVEKISFWDRAGHWLVLEDISFGWSPLSLFKGIFHIQNMDVRLARLNRFTQGGKKSESGSSAFLPRSLYLQRLRLDRLIVEQFSTGDAILGKHADFMISGRIRSTGSDADGSSFLRLDRIGGTGEKMFLEATLVGDEPVLSIGLDVEEDADGLVQKLLEIHRPITISFHGKGPVDTWKGKLKAHIGGIGSLDAEVGFTVKETPAMTAQGVLRLERDLIPAQVSSMLGSEGRLELAVRLIHQDMLSVDHLKLNAGAADMNLSGRMNLEDKTVDGKFTFGCKNLDFRGASSNLNYSGTLEVGGHFSGPVLQPRTFVNIKAADLELDRFNVSNLIGEFDIRFLSETDALFPGVHIGGNGHMENFSFRDPRNAQRPFPEPNLKWSIDADVPLGHTMHIQHLELAGKNLMLGISGHMDTAGPGGMFDVLLDVEDTQGLSDFLGFELPGSARFHARIQGDEFPLSLTAHVQGKINLASRKFQSLAPVFSEEIGIAGDLILTEAKRLETSGLCLETGAGTFLADGSLDLPQGSLDGSWGLSLPELAVFSHALKRDVGGSLHAKGKVKGVFGKMTMKAEALIQDCHFQGIRFDHAAATIHARETASGGAGGLSLELRQEERKVRATSDFILNSRCLEFSALSLDAAGSRVYGDMTYFLDRDLAKGALKAECEDISAPAALFGKDLKGSVHSETQFQIAGSEQQVLFVLRGSDLSSNAGRVSNLKINGRLTNLTRTPQGNVVLDMEGLSFSDLSLASLTLGAEGNTQQVIFSGKAAGKYKSDFKIEASGRGISSQKILTFNLEYLNGQICDSVLSLSRTTQIKRMPKGWEFGPFFLDLGQGHVTGLGSFTDGMLDIKAQFEELPVEALQFTGLSRLHGIAAGRVYLSGPMSHPQGGIMLRLNRTGFRDGPYRELPPSVLQVKADLKNDYAHADITLEGLADKPIEIRAEIPIRFSLSPFAWDIPRQGKLQGRLAGGLDLSHFSLFADLPDQNLHGQMEIGLSLDGTAGDPRITGYARIQDGVYENVRSGTFLKDAEVEIAAHSSRLTVERGVMRDREGGTISFKGGVDLIPAQDFPFDVELLFEKAALVRHDYATATAGGRLSLSGSLSEAILAGQLEIVSADFQIPKRLPPGITELEVVEMNRTGEVPVGPQQPSHPKTHVIKLNASVLSPGHVFIRGRGLESEWKGNLQITGNSAEPVVTGRLSVVRGFFNFLGKRFNLKEGQINFYGAFPPSPSLDMMAEFSTRDMLAHLRLSGSITEPVLELSSEPSLPKDEILSQILFGRSRTEISPVQAIKLAQAVDSLAGGDLDFLGRVRRFLGVDQLEVKQTENERSENDVSQTGIESSAISVGKYVNEKVYVTTERGMQDESGKVSVEVEVTPNITVETEVKEDAEGGVGVRWKWNY